MSDLRAHELNVVNGFLDAANNLGSDRLVNAAKHLVAQISEEISAQFPQQVDVGQAAAPETFPQINQEPEAPANDTETGTFVGGFDTTPSETDETHNEEAAPEADVQDVSDAQESEDETAAAGSPDHAAE